MFASDAIIIFDTTLRDGEQSPGNSMNLEEKLLVAEALDAMGVDVIEAGFAMASNGDFEAVKAIAGRVKHAVPCSLARAKPADIERAAEALKPARHFRIHTFMSTSEIHLKYQFRMEEPAVLELIKGTVALARRYTDDVEWSAMDATRTRADYLCQAVETAIKAGATTINIPDTVGYTVPDEYHDLILMLKNRVPNIDKAILSTHCQNDLGLATANSLAAVRAGARQIECTINGIGERAGNTALEEVVMALHTRKDLYPYSTRVKTEHIMHLSRLVTSVTGQQVQNNKAIVGANAFAHESGIHQDGMLKHAGTYEIMTPESVGLARSNLVMGKHSGRHAFKDKLQALGITLGDNALEDAFARFKDVADKKKEIHDEDIVALLDGGEASDAAGLRLVTLHVACGTGETAIAQMTIEEAGVLRHTRADGVGAVDAIFRAISELVPHTASLMLYQVHGVTQGTDAQAEVTVRLADGARVINGHGADMDTLVASAKAYLDALRRFQQARKDVENIVS